MAEEFKLREPALSLRLCGLDFCIELSGKTADTCSEILSEAKGKLAKLKNKEMDSTAKEAEICDFLKTSIDKLLGVGAVDKLFGPRPKELSDLADLMCYVVLKIRKGFLKDKKTFDNSAQ